MLWKRIQFDSSKHFGENATFITQVFGDSWQALYLSEAEDEAKAAGKPDGVRDTFLPGGVAGRAGVALSEDRTVSAGEGSGRVAGDLREIVRIFVVTATSLRGREGGRESRSSERVNSLVLRQIQLGQTCSREGERYRYSPCRSPRCDLRTQCAAIRC